MSRRYNPGYIEIRGKRIQIVEATTAPRVVFTGKFTGGGWTEQ